MVIPVLSEISVWINCEGHWIISCGLIWDIIGVKCYIDTTLMCSRSDTWHGNVFRVTDPLWEEFTYGFASQRASNNELSCWAEQDFELTEECIYFRLDDTHVTSFLRHEDVDSWLLCLQDISQEAWNHRYKVKWSSTYLDYDLYLITRGLDFSAFLLA